MAGYLVRDGRNDYVAYHCDLGGKVRPDLFRTACVEVGRVTGKMVPSRKVAKDYA